MYKKNILLKLLISVIVFYIPPVFSEEKRVALVIGNADYSFSPLNNPVNDAEGMSKVLKKMGFTVLKGINLDRKQMRIKIREFGQKIKSANVSLFYFAGHGVQYEGENYLLPLKTDITAEDEIIDEAVNASAILRKMESAGTQVNIVVLDACRNNPFKSHSRSASRGLRRIEGPKGSLIAYATAPGSVAADGKGKHGLYTENLIKFIQEPIPLEKVFKKVRIAVSEKTKDRQIPWENSSLVGEDFYFLKKKKQDKAEPKLFSMDVNYVYRASGQGDLLPIKQKSVLHSGDYYKVIFTPNDQIYIYIFQVDTLNNIYQLFPLGDFNNPVKAGKTYTIPSETTAFSLDDNIGNEYIYFVISKKRNTKVEALYKSITKNKNSPANNKKLQSYFKDRGMGKIVTDKHINMVNWGKNNALFSLIGQKLSGICENCVSVLTFQHQ